MEHKTIMKTGIPKEYDFLNMKFAPEITSAFQAGGNIFYTNPFRGCIVLSRNIEG